MKNQRCFSGALTLILTWWYSIGTRPGYAPTMGSSNHLREEGLMIKLYELAQVS